MLEKLKKLKDSKYLAIALANPYYLMVGAAIIVTLAAYVYVYYKNIPSENERNIQQLNNESVELAPEANTAKEEVVPAREESRRTAEVADQKTKKAEAARNANTTNTNYTDANAARCEAYPESKECSKQ